MDANVEAALFALLVEALQILLELVKKIIAQVDVLREVRQEAAE